MAANGALLRRWLTTAPGRDDLERRQAVLLQAILLLLTAVVVISTVATVVSRGADGIPIAARGLFLLGSLFLIPVWLLHRGHFPIAAAATVLILEFLVVAVILDAGPSSAATGVAIALPMTIAALVLRRTGLLVVTAVTIAAVLGSALSPAVNASPSSLVWLIFTLVLLAAILDQFGVTVREALGRELIHRRELEHAQVELVRRAEELTATNARLTREKADREAAENARRAIEAKVLEVQKLESLGVLAGGIAHDFNNLLVAVMGNAGLALLELPDDSPARASIADIETAGRRAGELARQMLSYSGRSRGQVEPIELAELVTELLALLHVSIGKGVTLRLQLPETPLVVDGDPAQLRQVVMNLVINAADAVGRTSTGTVSIRAHLLHATAEYLSDVHPEAGLEPGAYASLEVADTGVGMDPATRDRIFDPFFTTKDTGRGLGLAAVLGIVHRHGGAIRVYSELGHGTTFRILLPVSASVPVVAPELDGAWRAEGTVLVVDDDPGVRRVASRLLESFGLTVRTASSGAEGLAMVEAEPTVFDAVLLDLTMPGMSGSETFERLHAIRSSLPVVLMSGYHEEELRPELDGRINGFIQKPFTPGDLARRMRVALGAIDQAGGERRDRPTGAGAGAAGPGPGAAGSEAPAAPPRTGD